MSITSPATRKTWQFRASALYSNAPTADGSAYGYRQVSVEFVKAFD